MPITLTVTCDTDEELARFLENLRFAKKEFSKTQTITHGKEEQQRKAVTLTSKKSSVVKPEKSYKKPKTVKSVKLGKKQGKLAPIIESSINEIIKKGKPFRSRDVIAFIMKKDPGLNENSVTTAVSKTLSEKPFKWEQIKDTVGRPYKLYKP